MSLFILNVFLHKTQNSCGTYHFGQKTVVSDEKDDIANKYYEFLYDLTEGI
jgi:hypothetical protein